MEGGRGSRRPAGSSSAGVSWATFEEKAKDYELKSGLRGPARNPFSPTTRQLCREDMAIYGEEPASDSLALVVCEQCGRVVKSQALSKHKELYHTKVFHIPPPKQIGHTRIHTVGQPSSGGTTDEPRGQFSTPGSPKRRGSLFSGVSGGGGVMGFAATELPRQKSSNGLGVGERQGEEIGTSARNSKEYDPNRHCGVWVEDEQRHCTRSLTCKFHSLSLKGRVSGRSRPYAELLEEHRRRKKLKKQGKIGGVEPLTPSLTQPSPSAEPPPLTAHPLYPQSHLDHPSPPLLRPTSVSDSVHFTEEVGTRVSGTGRSAEWDMGEDQSEDDEPNDRGLPSRPDYPVPLAVSSFGARSTRCGSSVFGRHDDHLRSVLASLSGRTRDFTETTLHRKHSYSALLQQRQQRKYFTHKDMFSQDVTSLRPITMPTAGIKFTPPLTEYTSPLPPPSPPPTIPIITRPHAIQRQASASARETSTNHVGALSLDRPPRVNEGEGPCETEAPPPPRDGEKREGERRPNEHRRRRGRGRRKRRRSGGQAEGETDPATDALLHNHLPHPPPEATTVAGATQGGVADLPSASRVVGDGTRGASSSLRQQRAAEKTVDGRGRGSMGEFRMVRIKEEPMDEESDYQLKTQTPKPNSLLPNGIVTTPPPHPSLSTPSQSPPIHSYNAASAGRGAPPQSFVINPSSRSHPLVSPHLGGLLPIRGSVLQRHHSSQQQQQQQQQHQQQHQQQQQQQPQLQSFTFGHSLQGLPMQMLNDTLQRHMLQRGTFWLTPPPQTHPTTPQSVGGASNPGAQQQQNLVAPSIIHSLGGSPALPGYPQALAGQPRSHPAQLFPIQRASANHTPTSGRVRAPISPVPSGVPLHETLYQQQQQQHRPTHSGVATATTLGGASTLFGGQSSLSLGHHGNKHQSLATPPPGSTPFPSQRVT